MLKEKHKHSVPGYPVYPPVVSYSYRTEKSHTPAQSYAPANRL